MTSIENKISRLAHEKMVHTATQLPTTLFTSKGDSLTSWSDLYQYVNLNQIPFNLQDISFIDKVILNDSNMFLYSDNIHLDNLDSVCEIIYKPYIPNESVKFPIIILEFGRFRSEELPAMFEYLISVPDRMDKSMRMKKSSHSLEFGLIG